MTKTITFKLPGPLDRRLTRFARVHDLSKNTVVCRAIEGYIGAPADATDPCSAAAANKWLGLLNGPADLSTKAEHCDDFGR